MEHSSAIFCVCVIVGEGNVKFPTSLLARRQIRLPKKNRFIVTACLSLRGEIKEGDLTVTRGDMRPNLESTRESTTVPERTTSPFFLVSDYTSASHWEHFIASLEGVIQEWISNPITASHSAAAPRKEVVHFDESLSFVLEYHHIKPHDPTAYHVTLSTSPAHPGGGEFDLMASLLDLDADGCDVFDPYSMTTPHSSYSITPWNSFTMPIPSHFLFPRESVARWTGLSEWFCCVPFCATDAFEHTSPSLVEGQDPIELADHEKNEVGDEEVPTKNRPSKTPVLKNVNIIKLLMSAFAIALRNTNCSIPAIIPYGSKWKCLATGIFITPSSLCQNIPDRRFKMIHSPIVIPYYSSFPGIYHLLRTVFQLNESHLLAVTAMYTYHFDFSRIPSPTMLDAHADLIPCGPIDPPLSDVIIETVHFGFSYKSPDNPDPFTLPLWKASLSYSKPATPTICSALLQRLLDFSSVSFSSPGPSSPLGNIPGSYSSADDHTAGDIFHGWDAPSKVNPPPFELLMRDLFDETLKSYLTDRSPSPMDGGIPSGSILHKFSWKLVSHILDRSLRRSTDRVSSMELTSRSYFYSYLKSFWAAFLSELKERIFRSGQDGLIPNVDKIVNLNDSLVYQKLCFLNALQLRQERENHARNSVSNPEEPGAASSWKSDISWVRLPGQPQLDELGTSRRLGVFRTLDLFLLRDGTASSSPLASTIPMCEPYTHEPLLFPQGMQQENFDVSLESLVSDMRAFKAANPVCSFPDFIRWHSPKDWIVDANHDSIGSLSARMTSESQDNVWKKLWYSAEPAPIYEQESTIDFSVLRDQILNELETLSAPALIYELMPSFVSISLDSLSSVIFSRTGSFTQGGTLATAFKELNALVLSIDFKKPAKVGLLIQDIAVRIQEIEILLGISRLVKHHGLSDTLTERLIQAAFKQCSLPINESIRDRKNLAACFIHGASGGRNAASSTNVLPSPSAKEFIFSARNAQVTTEYPSFYARVDEDGEFRIVSCS